jgi:hypothetical protein
MRLEKRVGLTCRLAKEVWIFFTLYREAPGSYTQKKDVIWLIFYKNGSGCYCGE